MHRLEERRVGPFGVQVAAGGQAHAALDGGADVGDDIAEQVVGNDHVEPFGGVDQMQAHGVDVVVVGLHLRVFLGRLADGAVPEVPRVGEHVGLVPQGEAAAAGHGALEPEADDPLHAEAGVDRILEGDLGGRAFAQETPGARIGAFGVLAGYEYVAAVRRQARHRRGHPLVQLHRAEVHVQVEVEAQAQQQAPFQHPGRDVGPADRPHQDGVVAGQLLFYGVGQHLAGGQIPVAAQVVVVGLEGEAEPPGGRLHRLQGLGGHLRADSVSGDDRDPVAALSHRGCSAPG